MYDFDAVEPIVRMKLGDPDDANLVWSDSDLQMIYDQFIIERDRRSPHMASAALDTPFGDEWNNALVYFMLSGAYGANAEDPLYRKRWEDYLVLYENDMDSLSLIK